MWGLLSGYPDGVFPSIVRIKQGYNMMEMAQTKAKNVWTCSLLTLTTTATTNQVK